jgi:hypothetical protein
VGWVVSWWVGLCVGGLVDGNTWNLGEIIDKESKENKKKGEY